MRPIHLRTRYNYMFEIDLGVYLYMYGDSYGDRIEIVNVLILQALTKRVFSKFRISVYFVRPSRRLNNRV